MDFEVLIYLVLFIVLFLFFTFRGLSSNALLNIKPKDLTPDKSAEMIRKLNDEINLLKSLGFDQFDYFDYSLDHLPLFAYFMKQRQSNIYTGIYLSGKGRVQTKAIFFSTHFNNSCSLTTSNHISVGRLPAIPGYYLQICKENSIAETLSLHKVNVQYIIEKTGANDVEIEKSDFRQIFNSKQIEIKKAFNKFIALKIFYYQISGKWKEYSKPISEQGVI